MADNSKIQWTDATFNPWRGCTKISAGCAHCYAETLSGRNPKTLGVWGPKGTRVVAAESAWKEPVKWNRLAAEGKLPDGSPNVDGHRPRVFCASLADVFEDWPGDMTDSAGKRLWVSRCVGAGEVPEFIPERPQCDFSQCRPLTMGDVRRRLFSLIDQTPGLDWLLVTKRPENILNYTLRSQAKWWYASLLTMPANVWLGVSVENRKHGLPRIDVLRGIPAAVRFLSVEPLLEDLGPLDLTGISWVIVGGESGPGSRPCRVEWLRSLVSQCKAAGVACFVKQLGSNPEGDTFPADGRDPATGTRTLHVRQVLTVRDKKGGDIAEFPDDLQVREFPTAGRALA